MRLDSILFLSVLASSGASVALEERDTEPSQVRTHLLGDGPKDEYFRTYCHLLKWYPTSITWIANDVLNPDESM